MFNIRIRKTIAHDNLNHLEVHVNASNKDDLYKINVTIKELTYVR
jgi:hypothetical protein